MKTIKQMKLKDKRVFLRCDAQQSEILGTKRTAVLFGFNVPIMRCCF